MPGPKSIVGQRGENAVQVALLRPLVAAGVPAKPFYPVFLGEKNPIFDLVVYLLDANAKILGPHFYAQIKTTQAPASATSCVARMNKDHVIGATQCKVPSYFIAVDASSPTTESCYVKGISHTSSSGIYKAPVANILSSTAIRALLYNEVKNHFSASPYAFTSGI